MLCSFRSLFISKISTRAYNNFDSLDMIMVQNFFDNIGYPNFLGKSNNDEEEQKKKYTLWAYTAYGYDDVYKIPELPEQDVLMKEIIKQRKQPFLFYNPSFAKNHKSDYMIPSRHSIFEPCDDGSCGKCLARELKSGSSKTTASIPWGSKKGLFFPCKSHIDEDCSIEFKYLI